MIELKELNNLKNEEFYIKLKKVYQKTKKLKSTLSFKIFNWSFYSGLNLSLTIGYVLNHNSLFHPLVFFLLLLLTNFFFIQVISRYFVKKNNKLSFNKIRTILKKESHYLYDENKIKSLVVDIDNLSEKSKILLRISPDSFNVKKIIKEVLNDKIESYETLDELIKDKNEIISIIEKNLTTKQGMIILSLMENKFSNKNTAFSKKISSINKLAIIETKNKKKKNIQIQSI